MAIHPSFDKEKYVTVRVAAEASGYPASVIRRGVIHKILPGSQVAYDLNSGRKGMGTIVEREGLRRLLLGEIDLTPVASPRTRERRDPPKTFFDCAERVAELEESVSQLSIQLAEMFTRSNYRETDDLEPQEGA